ncbi:hypothetical protein B0H14DRAFT_3456132 [Mycena olivaceomarginata]|nr:hypothetical protein B0H14DRAFT_3456132 [Mycena olivaceomarginata]
MPDPSTFVFTLWNQPFTPADRCNTEELTTNTEEQYKHLDHADAEPGLAPIRRTLLKSWRDVDQITSPPSHVHPLARPPARLHPCAYTRAPSPVRLEPCTSTLARPPARLHLCACTRSPAPARLRLCAFTRAPSPAHLQTRSPSPVRLHPLAQLLVLLLRGLLVLGPGFPLPASLRLQQITTPTIFRFPSPKWQSLGDVFPDFGSSNDDKPVIAHAATEWLNEPLFGRRSMTSAPARWRRCTAP